MGQGLELCKIKIIKIRSVVILLDYTWRIIVMVVCLGLSAMFSASETSLMSLNKFQLQQMLDSKARGARRVQRLLSDPGKLLSGILIGNNLVNIGASSILTSLAIDLFGSTGVGIATGVMTLLILMFGEITPKQLAAQKSDRVALRLAPFVQVVVTVTTPAIFLLNLITGFMIRLLGGETDRNQPNITEAELKTIINVSHREGVLGTGDKEMINNIFDFRNAKAGEVMVTRTYITGLSVDTGFDEMLRVINESQYSRIPVYEETMDHIVGILYVKDLLALKPEEIRDFDLRQFMREPAFTYEFKSVKELFEEMRDERNHMMVVLNEYGGTEGIITIEDLVEEIMGEIEDEYDTESPEVENLEPGEYRVNGTLKLNDASKLTGLKIESDDFDTIGGFLIGQVDRLPEVGEVIEYDNCRFVIESIDRNRIGKIRITIS